MSKCEHLSKKTNTVCGKPCEINPKKPRCEKHGGSDLKVEEYSSTKESIEVNPYKPASKEWLEWNKKMKKKVKKDEVKVIESNPYLEPSKNTLECASSLKTYKGGNYVPLCKMNGTYLLKGSIVYIDTKPYYVCKSIKIELHEVKTFKGWGTTEIELVKEEYDIDSKGQNFPINSIVIEENVIYQNTPKEPLENMTYRKYMKEKGLEKLLYFIKDDAIKTGEKEKLIECAGGYENVKYSKNYNRIDSKSEEKYSITIDLTRLSEEDLCKLIEKKLHMRETYGDDYMYREFLYKKYGVKKIGSSEREEAVDNSWKAFEHNAVSGTL
jgi:hypothetical protein